MNPFATLIDVIPLPYAEAVVATGAAMLGAVAGGVGTFTVLRRRSMFGDALSHGTLPGIVLAFLVVGGKNPVALMIGAVISALAAALLVVGLERVGLIAPDSAIGVVLSVFFSFGIVLLTHVAGTGNADQTGLDGYIFGQAAGMVLDDVTLIACVGGAALAVMALCFRVLSSASFDPGFTAVAGVPTKVIDVLTTMLLVVAITLGVRTVGVILMVSLLVAPTVAARQLTRRLSRLVPLAGAIGAACGAVGAVIAGRIDAPAGPVITLLAVLVALASTFFAPRRGVVTKTLRRRKPALEVTYGLR